MVRFRQYWLALALLGLLLSCAQPSPPPPQVVRVEVAPGGLLLTRPGESQPLSARAYDAQGKEVKANFTYSSSNPAVASVTPEGRVTAQADLGSARVVVQAGQARAEVGVMVAQPAAGATLVSDSQVVRIEGTDPNAPFKVGYRYVVTLEGVGLPAVGSVLMSQGSLPVAGRVVEARQSGNQTQVTLELVPLGELLTRYRLEETFNLAHLPAVVPDSVGSNFDVTPKGNGQYTLRLKPGRVIRTTARPAGSVRPMREFEVGPLECETELSLVDLSVDEVEVEVDLSSIGFELLWTEANKKLLMVGSPKAKLAFNPSLAAALEGSLECKLEFFQIPLPVPSVLSAIGRLYIPVGAGFEISGKVPALGVGFKSSTEYLLELRAGVECTPTCSFARRFERRETKAEFKWVLPREIPRGLKVEAEAGGFLFATINTGLQAYITNTGKIFGIRISDFEFFVAKAALKLEGKLASEETQVRDPEFAAKYGLSLELSLKTGKDLQEALEALEILVTAINLKFPFELGSSPTATTLTADRNSFRFGDEVRFRVKLDNTEFPVLGYQVEAVRVYRNIGTPENPVLVLANQATASPGQTEFEIPWVATEDGQVVEGSGERTRHHFVAFVKSKLLDTRLELGRIEAETFTGARGELDPTFGSGGKVTTDLGSSYDEAYALVLQPDGRLVAAGRSVDAAGNDDFALVRYNPDGSLDTSFGIGGKVTTEVGSSSDEARALVLQPDGKLVAAGYSSNAAGKSDFALVRINPNGSLDTSFGSGGKVTTAVGSSSGIAALVLQPDGKLVAAGPSSNGDYDFALVRYNPNGTLDPTFGSGGKVITDLGSGSDEAHALVLQPDGKLVAAGYSYNAA
ncbi:Ig-like domain-containing protein, partial [Meiothermus sp.]|uniref:Ig-like domain-containing protein n=1 Tax=Meiothermus sp. TaxID=1955249 RepID=UPI00298EE137